MQNETLENRNEKPKQFKNQVTLIGLVGHDADHARVKEGKIYAKWSMATIEKYVDKATGDKVEETIWHNIEVRDTSLINVVKNIFKGMNITVEGKLTNNSYEAKDGTKRYYTSVEATKIEILSR